VKEEAEKRRGVDLVKILGMFVNVLSSVSEQQLKVINKCKKQIF
jgi:hypothetical protein